MSFLSLRGYKHLGSTLEGRCYSTVELYTVEATIASSTPGTLGDVEALADQLVLAGPHLPRLGVVAQGFVGSRWSGLG